MSQKVIEDDAHVYDDVANIKKKSFNVHENKCYQPSVCSTVSGEGREKLPQRKKCSIAPLLTVVAIIMLIVTIAAGLAFAFIEISKLRESVAQLSVLCEMDRQTLNTSIDKLYQLNQMRESETQQLIVDLENTGLNPSYPAVSCAAILQFNPFSPSGHFWIRSSNGSAVRVYCDMTRSCGNITGGWMKVTKLDMTDNNTQCPSALRLRIDSNKRTCGIGIQIRGCSSVIFTNAVRYSKVCGRIKAYQFASPNAFGNSSTSTHPLDIGLNYVDGISLTHGNPKQHIWTFAAALDEIGSYPHLNCPCTNTSLASNATRPPTFVGNDYFCDTGSTNRYQLNMFYPNDPLWDGAGCGPQDTCCSLNNPPWFYKELPQNTTDDIEMRICNDQGRANEDTPIEMIQLYIQ